MQRHSLLEEREGGVRVTVFRGDVDERASVFRSSGDVRFVFIDENLDNVRVSSLRRYVQWRAVQLQHVTS